MIRPANPRFSFPDDDQGHVQPSADEQEHLIDVVQEDDETIDKIKKLPTGVGVILMSAGVAGVILPGPTGIPLVIAGGFVLAPNVFGKLDNYMKEHLPEMRHHGVQALDRFIEDMEKRYPSSNS